MFENEILLIWIIPLLIFIARIFDVSIGTIRIIYISRGWKIVAALLGFVEVFIWVLAITQIMKNLDNFAAYFAYAFGFSAGTYIGMLIEEKIAVGTLMFHVITKKPATKLIKELRDTTVRLTSLKANGDEGAVNVLYVVVKRKYAHKIFHMIKAHHPRAFLSVEDIRVVQESHPLIRKIASDHHYTVKKKK